MKTGSAILLSFGLLLLLAGCATHQPPPPQALVVTSADLETAAKSGDVQRLRELLKAAPSLLQHRLQDGGTWMHFAAQENQLQACRALFLAGIDLAATNHTGHTALHAAAMKGHPAIVEFLATSHPQALEQRCQNGMTPLLEAVHSGHTEAVRKAIAAGADLLVRNSSHQNALDIAQAEGRSELLRELRPQLLQAVDRQLHSRTSVALLDFASLSEPSDAHWSTAISGLLGRALHDTGHFRVLPRSSINHARQQHPEQSPSLTPDQFKALGRSLMAARIITGECRREGTDWIVTLHLINASTGQTSLRYAARSADWFLIRDQLLEQILAHENLTLSSEQWAHVRQRPVNSPQALEKLSELVHHSEQNPDFFALETLAREGLAIEPENPHLKGALAATLANQGRLYHARKLAEEVLAIDPRNHKVLHLLGSIEIILEKPGAALPFLAQAVDADPADVNSNRSLGEALLFSDLPELALFYLEVTSKLDPHSPTHHARLASVHHQLGNKAVASAHLRELERLGLPDPMELNVVGHAYAETGDFLRAAQAFERFVEYARSVSLNPPLVDAVAELLENIQARLVPVPVQASPPADARQLSDLLTPQELPLIEDPLASSPEIAQWSRELVASAGDSPIAKARAIFNALAFPVERAGQGGTRTARQVFDQFNDKSQLFNCQELAKLYVVLAREAGLQAFYVHLDRDYTGNYVLHDCAIVFTPEGVFLVDPAYHWFGVPHQQFTPLSDIEATGHHLLQKSGPDAIPLNQLGLKLQGDDPWAHIQFGRRLVQAGHLSEAAQALRSAKSKDPSRWDVAQLGGWIEYTHGRIDTALTLLNKALQENPIDSISHLLLADIYERKGIHLMAIEQYRAALRTPLDPAQRTAAEDELARLLTTFSATEP